jgi:NTP pyrophosphatase (non-canonical NTP hydrolase)
VITDLNGHCVDDATALKRLVVALDQRFPTHNTAADRLARLLEELGELAKAIFGLEQSSHCATARGPRVAVAKEMQDVLRSAAALAYHYSLRVRLAELTDDQTPRVHMTSPYVLLAELMQAGGALATTVNHANGMGIKRSKYGPPNPARLAGAVDTVLTQVIEIADYYDLREDLRASMETHYCCYQADNLIPTETPKAPDA